jgi:hypothetical protein
MENDEFSEVIDDLIKQGALEVMGVDSETGQLLYTFTEKLAEINPTIYNAMLDDFHSSIMRLWELGFFSMDVTQKNPLVTPTQKIFDEKAIEDLSDNDRITLSDILNKMAQ